MTLKKVFLTFQLCEIVEKPELKIKLLIADRDYRVVLWSETSDTNMSHSDAPPTLILVFSGKELIQTGL